MPVHRAAKSADELALLRAAAADLSDPVPTSVYCDFLQDRGDPRGDFLCEFLRVFDECGVPPEIPPAFGRAWADVLGLSLRRRLRNRRSRWFDRRKHPNGLAPYEPYFGEILRAMVPAVRMRLGEPIPAADAPVGSSRAGGVPDLPEGMAWPMQFLVQLDLAELAGTVCERMLPESGLLCIFHSPEHHDSPERRVFHLPAGTSLHRPALPSPYRWHPDWRGEDDFVSSCAYALELSDDLRGGRIEAIENLEPPWYSLTESEYTLTEGRGTHWLCTTFKPGVCHHWENYFRLGAGHLKIAEIDGFDDLDWGFGDGDQLHVFATVVDARAGRFESVRTDEI